MSDNGEELGGRARSRGGWKQKWENGPVEYGFWRKRVRKRRGDRPQVNVVVGKSADKIWERKCNAEPGCILWLGAWRPAKRADNVVGREEVRPGRGGGGLR